MNAAIRARAMSSPLNSPMTPHTIRGNATATTLPDCEPYAARTADSASSEPTERSMPPPMMTNVMPTAIRPRNELASRMFRKLSTLANRVPNTSDAITVTAPRIRNAPLRWSMAAMRSRRVAMRVASSTVPVALPVAAVTVRSAGAG